MEIMENKVLAILLKQWKKHYKHAFPELLAILAKIGFQTLGDAIMLKNRPKSAEELLPYMNDHGVSMERSEFLICDQEIIFLKLEKAVKKHEEQLQAPVEQKGPEPELESRFIPEETKKFLSELTPALMVPLKEKEEKTIKEIQARMEELAEQKRKEVQQIKEKWQFLRRIAPRLREERIKERNANLAYLMEHPLESELSKVNSHILNFQHGFMD